MAIPVLFTARDGVVFFRLQPVPDWVVLETKRAINREGLETEVGSYAFAVWLEAFEQLREAVFTASNQRKMRA